jgi:hypothetical protein
MHNNRLGLSMSVMRCTTTQTRLSSKVPAGQHPQLDAEIIHEVALQKAPWYARVMRINMAGLGNTAGHANINKG